MSGRKRKTPADSSTGAFSKKAYLFAAHAAFFAAVREFIVGFGFGL